MLLSSKRQFLWVTWKILPISVQNSTRHIAYLVIISQLHSHSAKLPEAEQSPNPLFRKALFLLHSSSLQHLLHPSSFLRLCSLHWARCPKGAIAALRWETCSRHSRRLMSMKPAKMTNSWRKKRARTQKCHNFLDYLPRRRSSLYVGGHCPRPRAFLDIHKDGFQDGNATFSTRWKAPFHSEHLSLPPCGYTMGTHSTPLLIHSSPAHPRRWYVLALGTLTVPGLCFLHLM